LALLPRHCCTLIIVYVRPDNATWTGDCRLETGGRVKFKGSLKKKKEDPDNGFLGLPTPAEEQTLLFATQANAETLHRMHRR